jgi:[ribosomal protein S5]-alanine N-acetyltransferase
MIAETDNLIIRRFKPEDAEAFYMLNADSEVIRYTANNNFKDLAEAENFIRNYDHYEKYDFGRWAIELKSSGECMGWCGLRHRPETQLTDLGYRYARKFWNQGFATEAALKCLELGFEKYSQTKIIGRVMEGNQASVRVLEKIGMHYIGEFEFDEHRGLLYSIEKADFLQKK